MDIKRKATIIFTKDLAVSKKFYTEILGFKVEMDFSSVVFYEEGIASWQLKPEEKLISMLGNDFFTKEATKMELYFEVFDFNELVEKVKLANVELLHDVYEESHGQRTIRLYDPDRNIIELGEPLEVFIRRDFDSGVSLDDLVVKHKLPKQDIADILELKNI